MKSFFIKVLGCQYNESDAARLAFVLRKAGLSEVASNDADLVFLINCSVRKSAVDRCLSFAKNFVASGKKVFISGCVLDSDRKKFVEKGYLVWDENSISTLAGFLQIEEAKLAEIFRKERGHSSLIPITKGCNNFCSYCAVPYTRGREVSRPMDEILDDVRKLVGSGIKEITLLGQNVNSYKCSEIPPLTPPTSRGESLNSPPKVGGARGGLKNDFAILLEEINKIPGDFMVTFTSNHPKDMTDNIIEAIATLPKIEKSIHLPLQSGSNKILKAMNRPYTKEQYLDLVNNLKLKISNLKLTTDTIVGFPGETEEDFQQTAEVLKQVNYYQAYNNKYSPRKGTKAFDLGDPIPWKEKERRWRILNEISNVKSDTA